MTIFNMLLHPFKKRITRVCLSPFICYTSDTRSPLSKVFSITIALVTSCLSFSTFSADNIIATGDFETGGISHWRTFQGKNQSRQLEIVTSPVRQGKYAAKFIVGDGDKFSSTAGERSLVSTLLELWPRGGPDKRDGPGDEFYYAWSTLFPKDFPPVNNWMPSFMEWHSGRGGTRSVLAVRIRPGSQDSITIMRAGGTCSDRDCGDRTQNHTVIDDVKKGVWNDFVVHAKWSCSNDGIIEVWHKYENEESYKKILSVHDIPTLQSSDYWGDCMKVYKVLGFYRSASEKGRHTIYHDGFTQGTTFEAVTRRAHGTAATQTEKLSPPSNLQPSP